MKKYTYTFNDAGKNVPAKVEIEIDNKWAKILSEFDTEEKKNNYKENRRRVSLDAPNNYHEIADDTLTCDYYVEKAIGKAKQDKLVARAKYILGQLTPNQADSFYKTKVLGSKTLEVAKEKGVDESAVRKHLRRANKTIGKIVEQFGWAM